MTVPGSRFQPALAAALALLLAVACAGPSRTDTGASKPGGSTSQAPASAPAAPPPASAPAASAPAPTSAPAPVALQRVKMSQPVESLSFTSVYVARHLKLFEEEGFDVEMIMTQGGGPDTQVLIANEVQFNITAPSNLISAAQEGAPLIGVVNILNRLIINGVMHKDVAAQRGITASTPLRDKLAAMRGLTVGGTRPGALSAQVAQYAIRKGGLTLGTDATLLGIGSGAAMIAALDQRKVDVIFNSPPEPQEIVRTGLGVTIMDNTNGEDPDLGEFLQQVLLIRSDYGQTNADAVRRMVRALVKANRWVSERPAEDTAAILREYFPTIDEGILLESTRAVKPGIPADGRLSERGLLVNYDLMELAGTLKTRLPWTQILTNEYLP